MKKFKLLAIFLATAVIGLASMSKTYIENNRFLNDSDAKNAIYIDNDWNIIKYKSNASSSEGILEDIRSIRSNLYGEKLYVRDYSMYQRLKAVGAYDITNSSDEIVREAKSRYGYNIYIVRF